MPAGNKAGYGKYNDIMPRMRDTGGDNIRAMTGRPATMDEGQRQYMLDQGMGAYADNTRARFEQGISEGAQAFETEKRGGADDQQPNRAEMIMQGSPNDYLSDSPFKGFADYINQRQQRPEATDAETQNRGEAMNMMMQQMQGVPQQPDQRGAYLKALQDALRNGGLAEI